MQITGLLAYNHPRYQMLDVYVEVGGRLLAPMTLNRAEALLMTPELSVYILCEHWTYEDYLEAVIDDVVVYHLFCEGYGIEPAYNVQDVLDEDALKIEFLLAHGWWTSN